MQLEMASKVSSVKIVALTLLSVQVSSWTVDLAAMNLDTTTDNIESVMNDLEDVYDAGSYSDLEYQSYMEKKIHGVLNNGSIYLDGLRKAMASYRERLDNCTSSTTTMASTWLPENDPSQPSEPDPCSSIMAASDQVTKLSELALWATNELRERKFADKEDTAHQEEELLMKLAWFLDQLSQLTGYTPDPTGIQLPSTTDITATETDTTTSIPDTTLPLEIMQTVESRRQMSNVKSIKKRSVNDETSSFVKNYIKYKVWNIDNTEINTHSDAFDVNNEIDAKSIQKRAISKKALLLRPPTRPRNVTNKHKQTIKYILRKQNGGVAVKIVRKVKPKRSIYEEDGLSSNL